MRVLFIGTGEIGLPVLRWLLQSREHQLVGVVTQPDKPVGRAQRIQAPPIKAALSASDLPILQPERIRREEAITPLRALAPEVIVVMAYGQILPRSVLEIPPVACLNLHASLLPKYRGAAPIQAAIAAGEKETGITVMYMDEGLDTGDILLEKRLALAPDETGGSLHDRLGELAPAALAEALQKLADHQAPRVPQDPALASHAPKLEREHGRIDWSQPAELLERKIRAYDPWPGTFTTLRDEARRERKVKVFRAVVVPASEPAPGQVLAAPNELTIACGRDALRLQEVQPEGKKRMRAEEFLRGYRPVGAH